MGGIRTSRSRTVGTTRVRGPSATGVTEGFGVLNAAASGDEDTIELLRSGVFEILCDTALGEERARAHLVPPARTIFEEVAGFYEAK